MRKSVEAPARLSTLLLLLMAAWMLHGAIAISDDNRCSVKNSSKQTICLSAVYTSPLTDPHEFTNDGKHPPFQNVCITPGNTAVAIYNVDIKKVSLTEWILGSNSNTFDVKIDRSLVAKDSNDNGVDFFYTKYNSDAIDGPVILTIYPKAPPATPQPTPTTSPPQPTPNASPPATPTSTPSLGTRAIANVFKDDECEKVSDGVSVTEGHEDQRQALPEAKRFQAVMDAGCTAWFTDPLTVKFIGPDSLPSEAVKTPCSSVSLPGTFGAKCEKPSSFARTYVKKKCQGEAAVPVVALYFTGKSAQSKNFGYDISSVLYTLEIDTKLVITQRSGVTTDFTGGNGGCFTAPENNPIVKLDMQSFVL